MAQHSMIPHHGQRLGSGHGGLPLGLARVACLSHVAELQFAHCSLVAQQKPQRIQSELDGYGKDALTNRSRRIAACFGEGLPKTRYRYRYRCR